MKIIYSKPVCSIEHIAINSALLAASARNIDNGDGEESSKITESDDDDDWVGAKHFTAYDVWEDETEEEEF